MNSFFDYELPILAVDASGAAKALLCALPGLIPDSWPSAIVRGDDERAVADLLRSLGVSSDVTRLVCTSRALFPANDSGDGPHRMQLWKEAVASADGDPLRMFRPVTGTPDGGSRMLVDPIAAVALAALSDDRLRRRCWEEGVTVLWAGEVKTWVLLLFRERICASYEHRAAPDAASLAEDIHQLQLNWLPAERMQRSGGSGCFIHHYPPEAEGFRPVYLFGPLRERFSGMGKMAAVQGDPAFAFCRAIIDGYLRSNVQ